MDLKPLSTRTCLLLILLFGIAAYSNSLTGAFQFDDIPNILENRSLQPLDLGKLWIYHPLRFIVNLSFAFNIYLTGFATWGFHVVNLLIHILASCVVFNLTLSILNTPAMKNWVPPAQQNLFAVVAALLFLTHPVQTQAVTYIVQRLTSMAALFYLATLWMYLKARLEDARYYRVVFLLMLAAMLTKEISFTLPFAILLSELFFFPPSAEDPLGKKLIRWLPFAAFLLIIPLLYLTNIHIFTRDSGSMNILPSMAKNISRWDYFLTQFRVERTYLRLLFFPVDQCLIYDYRLSKGWGDPDTWVAFSLLFSVLLLSLACFKKNRLLTFGVLWFFLTLSVESSFIPVPDLIFEHRLYLPTFGFVLFLTSLLWTLVRSVKWFTAVSLVITVVFSGMTYARNEVWKSKLSLAQDVVKKTPHKGICYAGLGDAYRREVKDYKAAAFCFQKALDLGFTTPLVFLNLSEIYFQLGDREKSVYFKNIALSFSVLRKTLSFYDNQALTLINKGEYAEAVTMLKKDIQISPQNPWTYIQLGEAYRKMQQEDEAVSSFRKAIELAPLSQEGYNALAFFYKEKGDPQKAVDVLVEYLKFKKKHKPLFGN
ncbi:MAG: tetratricopeptide repeat protein [Candidatus Omnitrophota bacterium]